jgi:hypothetical protein
MNKISIVNGTSKSLIDGVTRRNIDDDSFYYLDDLLLLQTHFDLDTLKYEVIIKQNYLTNKEREVLDRLLIRLNLKPRENILFKPYGKDGWIIE